MSRFSQFWLLISLSLAFSAANAAEGQWYLAPGVQWIEFKDNSLDDGVGFFAGLGFQYTDRLAVELSSFEMDADVKTGGDIDLDHFKVDLLYDLTGGDSNWRPFLVGGLGVTDFDGTDNKVFDFGAGLKYWLNDNWQLRSTLRGFNYLVDDQPDLDWGIDASLVYFFGSGSNRGRSTASAPSAPSRPAPTPAPQDSDRDGVMDADDQCPDTPRNYAVDADGCPIPVEEVARVELLVNFEFDRSEVQDRYLPEIEQVANFMEQYPDTMVELEGHTDSVGTDAYNQGLSQRRANAVRQVMIDRFGVPASRVSAEGFGESQPVASNESAAGRAQNRRVITVIIKTLQNYQPR
jgi:OOP family OmpA-OmpF porin